MSEWREKNLSASINPILAVIPRKTSELILRRVCCCVVVILSICTVHCLISFGSLCICYLVYWLSLGCHFAFAFAFECFSYFVFHSFALICMHCSGFLVWYPFTRKMCYVHCACGRACVCACKKICNLRYGPRVSFVLAIMIGYFQWSNPHLLLHIDQCVKLISEIPFNVVVFTPTAFYAIKITRKLLKSNILLQIYYGSAY